MSFADSTWSDMTLILNFSSSACFLLRICASGPSEHHMSASRQWSSEKNGNIVIVTLFLHWTYLQSSLSSCLVLTNSSREFYIAVFLRIYWFPVPSQTMSPLGIAMQVLAHELVASGSNSAEPGFLPGLISGIPRSGLRRAWDQVGRAYVGHEIR